MTEKINALLYEWDPIDLRRSHVPPDEYMAEAKLIEKALTAVQNRLQLAEVIHGIFLSQCGTIFTLSIDDCLHVAQRILAL